MVVRKKEMTDNFHTFWFVHVYFIGGFRGEVGEARFPPSQPYFEWKKKKPQKEEKPAG